MATNDNDRRDSDSDDSQELLPEMFKDSFKFYKSKNPPPNLDKVFDFYKPDHLGDKLRRINVDHCEQCNVVLGLKPAKAWEIYELLAHPGLVFIKNPFTSIGQRYWTVRAIRDYSKKPNKSNLDALNLVPPDKDWWDICHNINNKLLVDKLRWVTLGYHHNWDTKIYSEENKGEFPEDLANLSNYIAQVLDYPNFKAEAAIVNYYHMDSTLSGHTDYSEQNLEAPLLSLSFGQTAVFLLGGKTKEEEPSAIFLRSGDIVVMSKESRTCFHGVPKILQVDSRFWDNFEEPSYIGKEFRDISKICQDEALWRSYGNYLSHSRININIRQVLKRGQKRLCGESDEKM